MNVATQGNLQTSLPIEGGCSCGKVRYRVHATPMIVHACHCSRCQKQTGAAYVINALIEDHQVELLTGKVHDTRESTASGSGQTITRCTECQVAVWSYYHVLPYVGDNVRFVRVGTLDEPALVPPDVHIHTSARLPHVVLPPETAAYADYYDTQQVWSAASMRRYMELAASSARAASA